MNYFTVILMSLLSNYEKAYSYGLKDKLLYEKILNINLVKQEFNSFNI